MTSLGMPLWLAKIIADTTMYLVSYSAQSRYVFAPEKEASGRQENTLDHSVSVQAAAVHSLRARAAVGSHNDTFRLSRAS